MRTMQWSRRSAPGSRRSAPGSRRSAPGRVLALLARRRCWRCWRCRAGRPGRRARSRSPGWSASSRDHARRRPGAWPKSFKRGAGARRAGRARQAAAGRGAGAAGAAGRPAGRRDRQLRRHLAARLHRPGRRRERQPLNASDKLVFWDYTGTKFRPALAKSWEFSDDGKTFTIKLREGHEVVRRRAVHRRRLRVLVRGHLQQQGPCADAASPTSPKRQAGRIVKVDETTVEFMFDDAVYLFFELLTGRHAHRRRPGGRQSDKRGLRRPTRRRTISSSSCRSTRARPQVNARATAAGFENWVASCTSRRTGRSTPICRCSAPGAPSRRSTRRPG